MQLWVPSPLLYCVISGDNFDNIVSKVEHALVVFYAPWCGHCKRIKPDFEKAAARIKSEKVIFGSGVVSTIRLITYFHVIATKRNFTHTYTFNIKQLQ